MTDKKLSLGAFVTISGCVVGRSEFQNGQPTYLVEYDQKGKQQREWFHAENLKVEEVAEGGGI